MSQNSRDKGVLSYTAIFKDIIIENIVYSLHTKGQNLRVLFKRFDKNSYGYITTTQFREMMGSICNLTQTEAEFLIGTRAFNFPQCTHLPGSSGDAQHRVRLTVCYTVFTAAA